MAKVATAEVDRGAAVDLPQGFTPKSGAILLVEDRTDVRVGLAQWLELNGHRVLDTATGEDALAHLTAQPEAFALVLLDLVLPGSLDGRHLRVRQLADTRLAAIPTVIVSACEPDLRGRAQLRPAAWVEKPYRLNDLLAIVNRLVLPERAA